jgi:hypothetical protein
MEGESGGLRVEGDWSGPCRVGRHIKTEIDLGALLLLHAERGGHWASRRKNLVLLRLHTLSYLFS